MQTKFPVIEKCTIQGESARKNLLAMSLSKYIRKHPDMVFPHRHNFYHFVLFTSGKGKFTIDFTNFTIEPFSVYFMIPGQVHTWDFEGIPEGYVVNFSSDFFHSFLLEPEYIQRFSYLNGIATDQVLIIPEDLQEDAVRIMGELSGDANIKTSPIQDLQRILLLHFLFLLEKKTGMEGPSAPVVARQTVLRDFKSLVEIHFREEKFPKFYADRLRVSPNHLNNICKNYLGKQAGEFIRERIILEAKRMLINPATTITSLSYELNFNDNSYFTKFFKKSEGMTPEEFRRKFGPGSV